MITLRDYQVDMINRTRDALRQHQRVVLQAPTGAGKTAIACYMMAEAKRKGLSSFFLVHQNELLKQTSKTLWHNKIEHGLIAAGKSRSPHDVQLASVMTLKNRMSQYKDPALIIIDEAHRALAPSYLDIAEAYPNAKIVGLTATPRRTDGKGLGHLFEDIVDGPSIQHLINEGFLCDYDLFGVPVDMDVSKVKTTRGDYDTAQLEEVANKPTITGDAIAHYKRLARGRKCVVLCVSIKHAEDVARQYNQAGIKAMAIHGKSTNRDEILGQFENGDVDVITSVQLLVEGVDIPSIGAVQFLRPTQSLVVYMQGIGRGLRPHHNKDKLIVLDHVGNVSRHGLPCDPRSWSLADKKKGKRGANDNEPRLSVQLCPQCHHTFKSGVHECPFCGTPVEFKERVLEVVDGELERIAKAQREHEEKTARRREVGMARSVEELTEIGKRRGMRYPHAWARRVVAARSATR